MRFPAIPARYLRAHRRPARIGAVARQRASAARVIRAPRDAFIERIVASRPLRVVCGALLVWSIAVQFVDAYSYSLIGWSDLWRDYDRPEQASLWRWDQPQIGYHLAHFSSERARKKQVMATYLNNPGPILNLPTNASGSTLGSH